MSSRAARRSMKRELAKPLVTTAVMMPPIAWFTLSMSSVGNEVGNWIIFGVWTLAMAYLIADWIILHD